MNLKAISDIQAMSQIFAQRDEALGTNLFDGDAKFRLTFPYNQSYRLVWLKDLMTAHLVREKGRDLLETLDIPENLIYEEYNHER